MTLTLTLALTLALALTLEGGQGEVTGACAPPPHPKSPHLDPPPQPTLRTPPPRPSLNPPLQCPPPPPPPPPGAFGPLLLRGGSHTKARRRPPPCRRHAILPPGGSLHCPCRPSAPITGVARGARFQGELGVDALWRWGGGGYKTGLAHSHMCSRPQIINPLSRHVAGFSGMHPCLLPTPHRLHTLDFRRHNGSSTQHSTHRAMYHHCSASDCTVISYTTMTVSPACGSPTPTENSCIKHTPEGCDWPWMQMI